jgi:hypothetical protein
MSVTHKYYGAAVSVPRAFPTGSDTCESYGSVHSVTGDVQIVDSLADGTVRRRKATAGMTLRLGDSVNTGEGSAAVNLANSKRRLCVLSNSVCFVA